MVTQTPKNTQSQKADSAANAVAGTLDEQAASLAAKGKGTRKGRFSAFRTNMSQAASEKVSLLSQAKQRLAEAADMFAQGGEAESKGSEIAANAARSLYQGVAKMLISRDEVTSCLGDIFGMKGKAKENRDKAFKPGDPAASKTPFGQGEAIRKRIVRAAQARDYVEDREATTFFDGLDKEEVSDALGRLDEGEITIWRLYDLLAEMKREAAEKPAPFAFNPEKVAQMASLLASEAGQKALSDIPGLEAAYAALFDVLVALDQTDGADGNETKH